MVSVRKLTYISKNDFIAIERHKGDKIQEPFYVYPSAIYVPLYKDGYDLASLFSNNKKCIRNRKLERKLSRSSATCYRPANDRNTNRSMIDDNYNTQNRRKTKIVHRKLYEDGLIDSYTLNVNVKSYSTCLCDIRRNERSVSILL